jgi:F-type H+-transporting ATPase subunit gamma
MATIKELRLRIKALKNTSKITAAMKMVSAAKLKRAQDAFARNKPYAERLEEMSARVFASLESPDHPLLKSRPGLAPGDNAPGQAPKVRYVLVTSDRGLAGAFNNGLLRAFARRTPVSGAVEEALGLGRRAREFAARARGAQAVATEFTNAPTHANAATVAESLIRDYLDGKCDRVVLVYNQFRSVLSQQPVFVPLLPLTPPAPEGGEKGGAKGPKDDYFLEPDAASLFADLLPKLVTVSVFRALLENAVGEHSARMTAMDSATKNTKDLIGSLSLTMNRARQAAITSELIEIVSGAEALKG